MVRGAAGGFGYWRCSPLPRAGAGGEAAAEAEETGWLSAWSGGAPSHRQYPFPGRGAASRLHEETKSAVRGSMFRGTAANQKGVVSLFTAAAAFQLSPVRCTPHRLHYNSHPRLSFDFAGMGNGSCFAAYRRMPGLGSHVGEIRLLIFIRVIASCLLSQGNEAENRCCKGKLKKKKKREKHRLL